MSTKQTDQQIRNWFHELRDHDLSDLRGLVAGVAEVLTLLAKKLPPGPQSAPIHREGHAKKGGQE